MRQVSDDILASYAIRMGDNCLILGQRISVWCGHAPSLEEDIALANTGLDLIGQTKNWFELACARDTRLGTPDRLTYLRDERDFTNCLLVEQPDQDYAYTLVRQFLFDAWHYLILDALIGSNETAIRDVAAKSIKEVRYHRTRSTDLITRLGGGSAESHEKMQAALDDLWRFSGELTAPDAFDEACFAAGFAPDLTQIATAYIEYVKTIMAEATLIIPETQAMRTGGKSGLHTESFGYLIAEMQSVHRRHPDVQW